MKTHTKLSIISLFLASALYLPHAWAAPQNVTGLTADATGPDTITLSWDTAMVTSDEDPDEEVGLVSNYRIYYNANESVQSGEVAFYEEEIDTPNNNTSFILTGLEPDTIYYFAVTGLDSEKQESIEYSLEAMATTPSSDDDSSDDGEAPKVVNALALSSTQVLVRFSEEIELPQNSAEVAFSIVEQINPANTLEVNEAVLYNEDPENKTVLLETDEQTNGTDYIASVNTLVKDLQGNVIVSGNEDSAPFEGTDAEAQENEEDEEDQQEEDEEDNQTNSQQLVNCGIANYNLPENTYINTLECFDNAFKTCAPAMYVKVVGNDEAQENYQYEIVGPGETGSCEVKSKYLKHSNDDWVNKEMTCDYGNNNSFEQAEIAVLADFEGASCSGALYELMSENSEPENTNNSQEDQQDNQEEDTTPPEDVTNLAAQFSKVAEKFMVALSWTASVNSAQDLVDQILYQSVNSASNYDQGKSLGANATNYDVENLEGGNEYYFKITTKDDEGNESTGAIQSIRLPQTGFGAGFLMLGSALGARQLLRRKRKRK